MQGFDGFEHRGGFASPEADAYEHGYRTGGQGYHDRCYSEIDDLELSEDIGRGTYHQ